MSFLPIQAAPQLLKWGVPAGIAAVSTLAGFAEKLGAALTPRASGEPDSSGGANPLATPPGSSVAANRIALQRELASLLETFHGRLREALAAGGISASGFRIREDALGDLRVAGPHPQQNEIELALAGDSTLQALFQAIESAAGLLHPRAANQAFAVAVGETRSAAELVAAS
jgi:hypothetical protein